MPVSFTTEEQSTRNEPHSDADRPTGSAGAASLDAIATVQQQETGTRTRVGAASGGVVAAPDSQLAASRDQENAPSARQLTKDEADRLYEENIEDEYAKREGGA